MQPFCTCVTHLNKSVGKLNSSFGVKDRRSGVAQEVGGDDLIIGNPQYSFHAAVGRFFHLVDNVLIRSRAKLYNVQIMYRVI